MLSSHRHQRGHSQYPEMAPPCRLTNRSAHCHQESGIDQLTSTHADVIAVEDHGMSVEKAPTSMYEQEGMSPSESRIFERSLYGHDPRALHSRKRRAPGDESMTKNRIGTALLLLSMAAPVWAASLHGGESLQQGQRLYSDDLHYFAIMQWDGNFVVYRNNQATTAVWSTGSVGSGASAAVMQTDGNFVLYTHDGRPVWWTSSNGPGRIFTVTELGQAMVLSVRPTWSSGTGIAGMPNTPPLIIRDTTTFQKGAVYSQANGHAFTFQHDGNLVLYRNGAPIWSTGTWRAASAEFRDGIHVYGGKTGGFHTPRVKPPKYGPGTHLLRSLNALVLGADGNMVAYGTEEIWKAPVYDLKPARSSGFPPCLGDPRACKPTSHRIWSANTPKVPF